MKKIGLFICSCDFEINSSIDLDRVIGASRKMEEVSSARVIKDLFSTPNLERVAESIANEGLDGVILASCSPSIHRPVIEEILAGTGLDKKSYGIVSIKPESGNGKKK
ncbi:MAG: hypothetical protein R3339_03745, partial [Thermodesulfobacteriota bacterium]|nr:hypothetical protein [Thermodesulfobacteriota bacterium]